MFFLSEPLGLIFFKFHVEPTVTWEEWVEIYTKGHSPLIKSAALPIYAKKNLKIFVSRTKKALRLNLGI